MGFELKGHEFAFDIIPIGIGYKCENCDEGEMYPDDDGVVTVPIGNGPFMRDHKCTKCGCKMKLPKTYPYIEWLKPDELIGLRESLPKYTRESLEEELKNKGLLTAKIDHEIDPDLPNPDTEPN